MRSAVFASLVISFVMASRVHADAPAPEQVLDAFLAAVKAEGAYTAEQKQKAEQIVGGLRGDPVARSAAIGEVLRELSPEFREALDQLADDHVDVAIAKLQPLTQSKNPYLAAEGNFYLGRALILQERYEQAVGALQQVTDKGTAHTLLAGEAWFLRGLCEVGQLQRDKAVTALERFLKECPDAPERLRMAARRQVTQLKLIEDGSLRDVWLRMDFIRRKLAQEDAGKDTRKQQDEVVALLDKLIKDAEEREAESEGQGDSKSESRGKSQGKGGGKQSGGQGGAPDGQENKERGENDLTPYDSRGRRIYKGPQSPWSTMRDKDREKVFQALEGKYPARYKQLIEQYYKSVQDEDDR